MDLIDDEDNTEVHERNRDGDANCEGRIDADRHRKDDREGEEE